MMHFGHAYGGARVLEDGKIHHALHVDGDPREVAECIFSAKSRKVGFGVPGKSIRTFRRRIAKYEDKVDSDSP